MGDVRNVEYLEAQQPFMRDIVDMGDMGDIGDTGEIQNNTMMTHPPTDRNESRDAIASKNGNQETPCNI